jgi:YD repeat-containing protein
MTAITHKKSDHSTFLSITYQFDKTGNPTKATENNGDVTDYTYDDLYRLCGAVVCSRFAGVARTQSLNEGDEGGRPGGGHLRLQLRV